MGISNSIKFTRFRKFNGSLTKVLSLTPAGEAHKDSAGCAMGTGSFVTLTIDYIRELPDILTKREFDVRFGALKSKTYKTTKSWSKLVSN